jgi:hypothetical protein
MAFDSIQASVGKHNNGKTNCYSMIKFFALDVLCRMGGSCVDRPHSGYRVGSILLRWTARPATVVPIVWGSRLHVS